MQSRTIFRTPRFLAAAAGAAVACAGPTQATEGALDVSFGDGTGVVTAAFDLGGSNADRAAVLLRDATGRLLVIGTADHGTGPHCIAIERFTADGVADIDGYGVAGQVCPPDLLGSDGYVTGRLGATLQADGKLLVAGVMEGVSDAHPFVCRFLDNGDVDTDFGEEQNPGCRVLIEVALPTTLDLATAPVTVAADAGAVYLSMLRADGNAFQPVLVRLSATGAAMPYGAAVTDLLPETLGAHGFTGAMQRAADGALLIAGAILLPNTASDYFVLRFDPATGALDPGFNTTGLVRIAFDKGASGNDVARSLALRADGAVIVAGGVQTDGGTAIGVAALSSTTGAMLAGFNGGAPVVVDPCTDGTCTIQPFGLITTASGKVAIAGQFQHAGDASEAFALRLRADGAPDAAFGELGPAFPGLQTYGVQGIPLDAVGIVAQGERLVLAGTTTLGSQDFYLLRVIGSDIFRDGFEAAD